MKARTQEVKNTMKLWSVMLVRRKKPLYSSEMDLRRVEKVQGNQGVELARFTLQTEKVSWARSCGNVPGGGKHLKLSTLGMIRAVTNGLHIFLLLQHWYREYFIQ